MSLGAVGRDDVVALGNGSALALGRSCAVRSPATWVVAGVVVERPPGGPRLRVTRTPLFVPTDHLVLDVVPTVDAAADAVARRDQVLDLAARLPAEADILRAWVEAGVRSTDPRQVEVAAGAAAILGDSTAFRRAAFGSAILRRREKYVTPQHRQAEDAREARVVELYRARPLDEVRDQLLETARVVCDDLRRAREIPASFRWNP